MRMALYRKYRPASFKDVMGQDHIVKVLENSVKGGKSKHHAFLFSGSRGIGKTSLARIFARELGCDAVDLYEIDAASQNSVDNIRDLSNSVRTRPLKSSIKVYILDEAHMLSKSAFNAFLKTLEEPPEHTIFVLATTEMEKLPDTVVSRCIPLQFRKPSIEILEKTIKGVADKEGYKIDNPSSYIISILSDGSFRDAIGILEKVILASKKKDIDIDLVREILGAPSGHIVNDYIRALSSGDVSIGIASIEEATKNGSDIGLFIRLVLNKIRGILLYRFTKDKKVLSDFVEEDQELIKEEAKKDNISLDMLADVIEAGERKKKSFIEALPLEALLIKWGNKE